MRLYDTFKQVAATFIAVAMMLTVGCNGDTNSADNSTSELDVVEQEQVSARVTVEGAKFMVNGKELWLSGGNTPWHHWNDFTGNMNEEYWEETFAQLASDNINCTRIWINCNGQNIIRLNFDGTISEIVEGHWTDLDKLFSLAEKYGVYVMPTLLSFDHFKEPKTSAELFRKMITSKEAVDNFADTYVAEFCRRYADNEYVFSVDLMNEPDWVYENDECGRLPWDDLSYFFGKCADTIHNNSEMLVTVGMGIIKYNSDKYEGNKIADEYLKSLTGLDGAYVDFYSTHYYSWQKPYFSAPFLCSPEEFGLVLDRPCIIGEASNDDLKDCGMDLTEKYIALHDSGWSGLLVWMEPRPDEESMWYRYDLTAEATNAIAEYISEKIYPIGRKNADVAYTIEAA